MMVKSPYTITIFVFTAILVVGRWFWYWGEIETAFLLLFFLLVTIGIRLDDILKKIDKTNDRLDRLLKKNSTGDAPADKSPVAGPERNTGYENQKPE